MLECKCPFRVAQDRNIVNRHFIKKIEYDKPENKETFILCVAHGTTMLWPSCKSETN